MRAARGPEKLSFLKENLDCFGSLYSIASATRFSEGGNVFEIKENHVLIDLRTYRVRPGKLPQELDLYAKHGFASQMRHLGPPIAYLQAESGDLNTLVHLWAFDNAGDRAQKRAAMMSDPEWENYLKLADEAGYLVEQRNSLMVPASFAPIKR